MLIRFFFGIRYGNLWDRDLGIDKEKTGFIAGLKQLAAYGLVLESANPNPALIAAIVDVADKIPNSESSWITCPIRRYLPKRAIGISTALDLQSSCEKPQCIYQVDRDSRDCESEGFALIPSITADHLDEIWNTFGEDHILFGSDWPNSDHVVGFSETLKLVREYMSHKSASAREKYFWKNSLAAYKWRRRSPDQPSL